MAFRNEIIPTDWEKNLMIPIHNISEISNCANYRAICSSAVVYKIDTRIVERKLRGKVESKLKEKQSEFRRNRS